LQLFLYITLWSAAYWISAYNHTDCYLIGRAILATLISSIILYLLDKAHVLFYLKQGWVGYTATLVFEAGEIAFLLLLVFFAWDMVRALDLHLSPDAKPPTTDSNYTPFVSIHVPICNEPVDLVSKTIHALSRLSYPAYEVIVVDNNTDDPALWMPIKACCEQLGFQFVHVNPHPGFKAGALNLALAKTSATASLIAVVDADYELRPEFLTDNVAVFTDPNVAFLQTPQRSKNVQANKITRAFNPVYDFFYDITMLARSQRNSIIFAGCAGLIRCSALREAGGWAEWSITEDAELSLRLLKLGYKGVYVNRGYGAGLMPETFNDIQKQWFRYFCGGLDITSHFLVSTILARNKLSFMQRLDFLMGGIINLGAVMMLLSTAWIVITAMTYSILQAQGSALAGDMLYWLGIFSNWLIVYDSFLIFEVFLLFLAFRLVYQFNWIEALGAAGSFLSLMTTQARAALSFLLGQERSFMKTPKQTIDRSRKRGIGPIWFELLLCIALGTAMACLFWIAPSKPVVLSYITLGLWQILIYGSTVWRAFQSP